jgi:hypothetical protein
MTSTKHSRLPVSAGVAAPATQAAVDPFILTLCRLAAPITIKPPTSPQLKPFTFFTSRSRDAQGAERLHLHMGFFPTLEVAQKWAQVMRTAYPDVVAARAPAALLQKRDAAAPRVRPAAETRGVQVGPSSNAGDGGNAALTDTQVLRILETRGPSGHFASDPGSAEISLLRPDDTNTRRALKEAVVQRAQVSFAVQLQRSEMPLDLSSLPSLSIFRSYTLYATQGTQEGRSWHALRLGFFSDAISAKQVAYYVRSSFASVAVVPITEEERTRADERRVDPATLAAKVDNKDSFKDDLNKALDQDRTPSQPVTAKAPPESRTVASTRRKDSLEQTLEMLAASEMWNDDEASQTGVRHLQFDVRKRM